MLKHRDPNRPATTGGIAILYWILGGLALIAFALSLAMPENPAIERLAPGLATEFVGILVTLVFVQRFLERQEKTRRLRTSVGALRRGARALSEMASVWGSLVKGAARDDADRRPASMDDLFAPHWTDSLDEIDATALNDEVARDAGPFLDAALAELADAHEALHELVIGYGAALRTDYVEAIDDLLDDPFLESFMRLEDPNRSGKGLLRIARGAREAHFRRLLRAIHIHNELAAEAAQVRDRRTAPRTDLVGMELPLDHDLKVLFSPDQRWWSTEPVPGRFREVLRRTP